jgi:hypothetical protein
MEGKGEGGWGGGSVRGQAPPSLMGSLYRNTEDIRAIYNRLLKLSPSIHTFITCHLLSCLISLRVFSSDAKIHCVPSLRAHSFIPHILLRCPVSLSAFSYGAQFVTMRPVKIFRLLLRCSVSLGAFSYGA